MELRIREAVYTDLERILEIINHAIETTTAVYDYDPRSFEMQEQWFAEKQSEGFPIFVAEYDNEVIGYGTYGTFKPKVGYRFSVEHSIYIAENARGKGVGKKLLETLITSATTGGYHAMIAVIDSDNVNSILFHKNYQFVEMGQLKEVGYKFDKWLDVTFMQLMLKNELS
ncbi:GNAT family N-acetyltransferase [Flavobacterium sp. '19STA2R22 D10 B1']|uniref:GNAT family N-acetyltransferase n=1 Tax=Flavobacterium aerium TaxID=3037261 RepID=UPI00278BE394|nr:GNAT family N-acetyltransferase [Flavobacterium sp. '19STA2R22 D10 B1']